MLGFCLNSLDLISKVVLNAPDMLKQQQRMFVTS